MSKAPEGISGRPRDQQNPLVMLKEAQSRFGYLRRELLVEVANSLGISTGEVYGVATFYSFLSTRPQGRNVIMVCKSLPCFLKSSQMIIDAVERRIGIGPGQTTPDGRFSLELTNCIGACDKAPAMMINHQVYGDLTARKISRILKACE